MINLRGMGGFCDDAYAIANNSSLSPLNLLKQVAMVNNLACKAVVGGYSQAQYGTITSPERILATLPPPVAPRTEEEMKTWDPETMDAANAAAYEKWKQEAVAMIAADEARGAYDPEGNLPFTAEWFNQWKWYLVGGAVVLAVLLRPRPNY